MICGIYLSVIFVFFQARTVACADVSLVCPAPFADNNNNAITCTVNKAEIDGVTCAVPQTTLGFGLKRSTEQSGSPLCDATYPCTSEAAVTTPGTCGCTKLDGDIFTYTLLFEANMTTDKGGTISCQICDVSAPPLSRFSSDSCKSIPFSNPGYICKTKTTVVVLMVAAQVCLGIAFIVAVIIFVCKGIGLKDCCQCKPLVIAYVFLVVPAGIFIAVSIIYQCKSLSVAVVVLIVLALVVLVVAFIVAVIFFVWKDPPLKDTHQWTGLVVGLVLAVVVAIILTVVGISLASLSVAAKVLIDMALAGLTVAFVIAVYLFVWKDPQSENAKKDECQWTTLFIHLVLAVATVMIMIAIGIVIAYLVTTVVLVVLIVLGLVVLGTHILEVILFLCWVTLLKDTCQWIARAARLIFSAVATMILTIVGFLLTEFPGEDPCISPCLVVIIFTVFDVVWTLIPAIFIIIIKRK